MTKPTYEDIQDAVDFFIPPEEMERQFKQEIDCTNLTNSELIAPISLKVLNSQTKT